MYSGFDGSSVALLPVSAKWPVTLLNFEFRVNNLNAVESIRIHRMKIQLSIRLKVQNYVTNRR